MRKYNHLLAGIARALDAAGLPYMVIGGQAVLVYGEPRFTRDIDITLGVDIDRLEDLKTVCRTLSLVPKVSDVEALVKQTNVYPVVETATNIAVDFIFSFSPFERGAMERVNKMTVDETPVCYASIEDMIILKIAAGRPLDLEDAKGMMNAHAEVDDKYIRTWLAALSVAVGADLTGRYVAIARTTGREPS